LTIGKDRPGAGRTLKAFSAVLPLCSAQLGTCGHFLETEPD
jgi:hypothetical protein